jgi:hypothetical protein
VVVVLAKTVCPRPILSRRMRKKMIKNSFFIGDINLNNLFLSYGDNVGSQIPV